MEIIKLSDKKCKLYLIHLKKKMVFKVLQEETIRMTKSFEKKLNITSRYAKHNNQNHKHN